MGRSPGLGTAPGRGRSVGGTVPDRDETRIGPTERMARGGPASQALLIGLCPVSRRELGVEMTPIAHSLRALDDRSGGIVVGAVKGPQGRDAELANHVAPPGLAVGAPAGCPSTVSSPARTIGR